MPQIAKQVATVLSKSKFHIERRILQRNFSNFSSGDRPWLFTENEGPNLEWKDITIPVPYGHIAAKAWGRHNGYPVLALHGWLDNCGSFDTLIPQLSRTYHIVAIDAPGHGLSSHRPPGCMYRDIDMVVDFKRVFDFMGWDKCCIIGHSMGAALGLMFSSLFPDAVSKLVVLDLIKPTSRPLDYFPCVTQKAISDYMKIEQKLASSPKTYPLEKAINRLKEGMFNEVTTESAEVLIKRGTRRSILDDSYVFTRDMRCKTIADFSRVSHEQMKMFMANLKCELLMILANNTHEKYKTATPEVIDEFLDIYRANCKEFTIKKIDGNHFVHINNPEVVAPLIDEFLTNLPEIDLGVGFIGKRKYVSDDEN